MLRGFDQFMNLVLESAVEEVSATERHEIGMIVRTVRIAPLRATHIRVQVIRGNSVVLLEPLEKV